MGHKIFDRVLETSTTTGTGSFTLTGSVTGFATFASVYTVNDTCPYYIEVVDANGVPAGAWETGIGTYSGTNTLARTVVLASSNGGSAVDFAAGTKRCGVGALSGAGVFAWELLETLSTASGVNVTSALIPQRFNLLLCRVNGVSHDSGSSQSLQMSFSNNGSTFTGTGLCGPSTANTVQWRGGILIPYYTADSGIVSVAGANITANNTLTVINPDNNLAWRVDGGIKYLRFAPSGGNFDAGSIDILAL